MIDHDTLLGNILEEEEYAFRTNEKDLLKNYKDAMRSDEGEKWKMAMDEKIEMFSATMEPSHWSCGSRHSVSYLHSPPFTISGYNNLMSKVPICHRLDFPTLQFPSAPIVPYPLSL